MPRDADEAGRPPRPESRTVEPPRGAAALADLLTSEKLKRLALPYPGYLAAWRLVKGHGKCIQGVNGRSTHRGTLTLVAGACRSSGVPLMTRRRAAFPRFSIPGGAGGRLRRRREAWLASWQLSCCSRCASHVSEADSLPVVFSHSVQFGED